MHKVENYSVQKHTGGKHKTDMLSYSHEALLILISMSRSIRLLKCQIIWICIHC